MIIYIYVYIYELLLVVKYFDIFTAVLKNVNVCLLKVK